MSANRLPPLKSLYVFRHAATHLSFKEAAEQLYVTQAAISQHIKTLEQHLDVTLFERHTRQVVLTQEGRYLLDYVIKAFDLLETGIQGITGDQRPNTIVITTIPSFATRWLVSRLGKFHEIEQNLNIQLEHSFSLSTFTDRQVDLAIRFGQGKYEGLESHLLFEEFVLPVCNPSLIDTSKAITPQLQKLPMISENGPDNNFIKSTLQKTLNRETSFSALLHVSDASVLVEALLSGQGIAMARFSLIYKLLQQGLLICPLPIYMKSRYDMYLVAPPQHFSYTKITRFKHWIEEDVGEIKQSWQEYLKQNPDSKEVKE